MIRFILFCLVMLVTTCSYAVRVTSLYTGKVPVASQSAEDKSKALPQALAQVIVKASGNKKVLANPDVKVYLNQASSLLQEFGYSASTRNPNYPYLLEVQFDPENVNKFLRDAAVPIWGANRPLILNWVEYEVPNHPAEIIDASSGNDIQTAIKLYADQRGLPIILPTMDMTDLNDVAVNDVVTMDLAKLQTASQRYASDAILMTRIFQATNGFDLQAKLVLGEDEWEWKITGKSRPDVIKALIDTIADTLAGRYAAVVTKTIQSKLLLKIVNVSQQDDFTDVLHYVERLPSVASVQVEQIAGDDLLLSVNLRGSPETFVKTLSVGKKMTPQPSEPDAKFFAYQWNR